MGFENIRLESDGDLTYLILSRPDKFNALARQTIREMLEALNLINNDKTARVVIIKAEGKHFCTGHDLSEMKDGTTVLYDEIFAQCVEMMTRLHTIPQPVIAQVHGIATAAGCQLVAACDMAVAEEGASFATPGVKIGLFCHTPMVPLVRAVGRKRAMEMLVTGRSVPAATAMDWGLVNKVVPKDGLDDATREMAQEIVKASPLTVALGKRSFYDQLDMTEERAYASARNAIVSNMTCGDAKEGIGAFLEKRKPVWQGK